MSALDPKTVRACIAWLHRRADEMNDPHAKAVLNSAAFSLGVERASSLEQPDPNDLSGCGHDHVGGPR